MGSYLTVFAVAAVASAVSMPLMMAVGTRTGVMDHSREPPVPRVGGWALALGSAAALVLVGVVFEPTGLTLWATTSSLGPVTVGATAILLLGTLDDFRPLGAWLKFGGQIAIAAGVYALGVRIELVSFPLGSLALGSWAGPLFTVVWLVGITNAFNLLDGADGVAAGSAFFSATAIFIMSVVLGHPGIGLVTAALAGALLGFLPFNFPPARAFLGDAGSMGAGFMLAGLGVEGSTKSATLVAIAVPLFAFAVPVFDTTITMLRRIIRGQPIFERDQEHVHHRLARAGFTPRQVAGLIYGASAVFALVSMVFINPNVRSFAVVLIMVGVGTLLVVRFLRLHELNELARLARRGAGQARAVAANVQLRRAAERIERAGNWEELLRGLSILFDRSEFDAAILCLRPADGDDQEQSWALVQGRFIEGAPERQRDEWEVLCPFRGTLSQGTLHLRRRLGRRSLMVDINLLMEIVQPALDAAAERIDAAVVAAT